jgi:hypothetical protein
MSSFLDAHRSKTLEEVRSNLQRLVEMGILSDAMLLIRTPGGKPQRFDFTQIEDQPRSKATR